MDFLSNPRTHPLESYLKEFMYATMSPRELEDVIYHLTKEVDYWWLLERHGYLYRHEDNQWIDRAWPYNESLELARQELRSRGFKPQASLRDLEIEHFNKNRLPYIESLTLDIGGYFGPNELVTVNFSEGSLDIDYKIERDEYAPPTLFEIERPAPSREELFQALAETELGSWSEDYFFPAHDGESWSLTITFSDDQWPPFKSSGRNAWPPNFSVLTDALGLTTNAAYEDEDEDWDEDWDDDENGDDEELED